MKLYHGTNSDIEKIDLSKGLILTSSIILVLSGLWISLIRFLQKTYETAYT